MAKGGAIVFPKDYTLYVVVGNDGTPLKVGISGLAVFISRAAAQYYMGRTPEATRIDTYCRFAVNPKEEKK